jgi:DNA-binding transcriptional MerR regulator
VTTTHGVARATGVTYRQLDYWARLGLVRPLGNGSGSGVARRWPERELRVVALIGRLVRAGLTLDAAAGAARTAATAHDLHDVETVRVQLAPGVHLEVILRP